MHHWLADWRSISRVPRSRAAVERTRGQNLAVVRKYHTVRPGSMAQDGTDGLAIRCVPKPYFSEIARDGNSRSIWTERHAIHLLLRDLQVEHSFTGGNIPHANRAV